MEWIILIIGYPVSYFLFKHALYLDRTHQYWQQKDQYGMWTDSYEGTKQIYKLLFLFPWVNFITSVIGWIVNFVCLAFVVVRDKASDMFDSWDPFGKNPNEEKKDRRFTYDERPYPREEEPEKKKSFFNNFKIKF